MWFLLLLNICILLVKKYHVSTNKLKFRLTEWEGENSLGLHAWAGFPHQREAGLDPSWVSFSQSRAGV